MTCLHERQIKGGKPERTLCADCGVLLQLTDPVIAAIVDTAPGDFIAQRRIAAAIGEAGR